MKTRAQWAAIKKAWVTRASLEWRAPGSQRLYSGEPCPFCSLPYGAHYGPEGGDLKCLTPKFSFYSPLPYAAAIVVSHVLDGGNLGECDLRFYKRKLKELLQ